MEEYFHCRQCDKEYLSRAALDEQSKILNTYVRYMGYCSENCFNKLSEDQKIHDLMHVYIYGDLRKREYSIIKRLKIKKRKLN